MHIITALFAGAALLAPAAPQTTPPTDPMQQTMPPGTPPQTMPPPTNPPPIVPPNDGSTPDNPASTTMPQSNGAMPPQSWKGSSDDWMAHMQRCQQKYPSYDPSSDQYKTSSGRMKTCKR